MKDREFEKNSQYDKDSFFSSNDERVNRLACKLLFLLLLAFPLTAVFSAAGLFTVSIGELAPVIILVVLLAVSTWVFMYFKLRSSVQKYYTILVIEAVVFVLAQDGNVSICISYVLAVAFSLLYFDTVLTVFTVTVSYILMVASVALRSPVSSALAGPESPELWFFSHSAGLTIEYAAISVIFIVLAGASRRHMRSEQRLLRDLSEEEQRYRMALEGSSDIILEYDVIKDFVMLYGSLSDPKASKLTTNVVGQLRSYMAERMKAFPEDYQRLMDYLDDKTDAQPLELRMHDGNAENGLRWIMLECSKIYEHDRLVKIIGKLRDITMEKHHEEELLINSRRDRLTKLISQSFGRPLVEEYLFARPKGETGVIGVVTIANFDKISAHYGSVFASTVIEQAAEVLKSRIDDGDIIYRLGDVNFLVLLKNKDARGAEKVLISMCGSSREVYSGENDDLTVVFNAGFVTTDVSSHYQFLVKCAMKALRAAADIGGPCCMLYDESMKNLAGGGHEHYDAGYDDDFPSDEENDIMAYCFRILEQTKDLKSAVNLLLARVGRSFGLCGIEVVETDWRLLRNTYLYCWSGSSNRELPAEDVMTKESFDGYINSFGADGIYENNSAYFEYIDESLRESLTANMPSQLRCAAYDGGIIRGAVIFEKSDPAYVWSDREKSELREIARIVSAHVIREKDDGFGPDMEGFLSAAAREIAASVNAISGMAALMLDNGVTGEAGEYAMSIQASAEGLLKVIGDMPQLSGTSRESAGAEERIGSRRKNCFTAPEARVLIVCGDFISLRETMGLMSVYRMKLKGAENGREAFELISSGERYDIIFVYCSLQDMYGAETAGAIRGLDDSYARNVPIVAVTETYDGGAEKQIIGSGMNGYLAKPIDTYLLEQVISRWIPAEKRQEVENKG